MTRRALVTGVLVTLILVAVAGCGRRGPLEPPGGTRVERSAPIVVMPQSQTGIAPAASDSSLLAPPANTAAGASDWPDGQQPQTLATPTRKVAEPKPKRSFFLDPLLN